MKKSICLFLAFWLLVTGYWLPAYAVEYTLAPNDTLEIKIIGKKDLDTKQTIAPDGTISLPVIGRIRAEDLSLKQLDEYLTTEFSKYIEKPQIVVYLTSRPIYVIQHDIKKNIWDVKEAGSIEEARALAGKQYAGDINYGDIITVETSKKPDFWEDNWYKVLTGTAVVVGIYATLHK
jgi:hypothetical protein